MALIYGNVPGLGEISMNANGFATEAQMTKLIAALTKTNSTTAKANAANAKAAQDAGNALDAFSKKTRDAGDEANNLGTKLKKKLSDVYTVAASTVSQVSQSFQHLASAHDSQGATVSAVTSSLANVFSKLMDSVSQVVSGLPILGTLISGISQAASAAAQIGATVVGFVTGMLDGLREQQKELFDSGVYFAKGIDDAAKVALDAGTTIGNLAKTAKDASDALRMYSGGSADGLRQVAKAFKQIDSANKDVLYSLGYTQDEIMSGIARFGASVENAGRHLSTKELADESIRYLYTLKELDRLTGTDAKARQAAADQLQRETAFRAYLNGLGPDQQNEVKNFIAALQQINPAIAEAAKARMLGAQAQDPAIAYLQNNMPNLMSAVTEFSDKAKAGALTQDDVNTTLGQIGVTANKELQNIQDALGGPTMLYYLEGAPGTVGEITKNLGTALQSTQELANAAKASSEKFDYNGMTWSLRAMNQDLTNNSAMLNKAISQYTDLENTLTNKFQAAAVSLTQDALTFTTAFEGLIQAIKDSYQRAVIRDHDIYTEMPVNVQAGVVNLQSQSSTSQYGSNSPNVVSPTPKVETPDYYSQPHYGSDGRFFGSDQNVLVRPKIVNGLPQRATGGPVERGESYVVGEKGRPEIFKPTDSGRVISDAKPIAVKIDDKRVFDDMTDLLQRISLLMQELNKKLDRNNVLTQQTNTLVS